MLLLISNDLNADNSNKRKIDVAEAIVHTSLQTTIISYQNTFQTHAVHV